MVSVAEPVPEHPEGNAIREEGEFWELLAVLLQPDHLRIEKNFTMQ
jgi:hypothetical protein